jgi:hypothetical protein
MPVVFCNMHSCDPRITWRHHVTTGQNAQTQRRLNVTLYVRFLSYCSILPSTTRSSKWFFPSGIPNKTFTHLKSALFWDITQRWVVDLYRRFATYQGHLQWSFSSWTSWPLKMRPIYCPETSVHNYHSTLRNIAEQRTPHLRVHLGGSLQ